jgi:hypothetical protein
MTQCQIAGFLLSICDYGALLCFAQIPCIRVFLCVADKGHRRKIAIPGSFHFILPVEIIVHLALASLIASMQPSTTLIYETVFALATLAAMARLRHRYRPSAATAPQARDQA